MSLLPEIVQDQPTITRTTHAMLVLWGVFAQQIGLVKALEKVPIPQRSRVHTPQTKLIEFLIAILSGCAYLQDISRSAHPLDQDKAVAQAWGQAEWADYSGVSRTLSACTQETVEAVREAVAEVSRPFIEQEVILSLQQEGAIIYDGDLTGRPVSKGSTTYEGAAFGWMDDAIRLGYQAAVVSMRSPTYGRLWLSVAHHPGNVVSSSQAAAMVCAAEARTGVRPLRRTELLAGRIDQQHEKLQRARERLQSRQKRYEETLRELKETREKLRWWRDEVTRLEKEYQLRGKVEKPYGHLAKARKKIGVSLRRLKRRAKELRHTRQKLLKQKERVQECQQECSVLAERYARFLEDNRTNLAPVRAIIRLDAGFGSGENIALLIEMGYEIYTKALNHLLAQAIRKRLTSETEWHRIGQNAEMTAWSNLSLRFCPYPLDVGIGRFHTTDQKDRYALFLHFGEKPVTENLEQWFVFYNGRQIIEAGIKEGKHVFQMHHLKVRSQSGLAIQEEFAALAANLVRWAALWLHEQCPDAKPPFDQPQVSVKQMVRVAAHTSAWVFWQPEGYLLLRFDDLSFFAGIELSFGQGRGFQLPLPLFRNEYFGPI